MVGVCGFVARKKWKNLRHPQGARQGAQRWDLTRGVGGRGQLVSGIWVPPCFSLSSRLSFPPSPTLLVASR